MNEKQPTVESIFFAALERSDPDERAAYLREACGGDRALLNRVQRLIDAHPKAQDLFESAPPGLGATEPGEVTEGTGTTIGPYKLLQQIGEGGFGVVYMAEQEKPIHRRVALKVIKPGMDSKQVIARFEAERQALALMDHQNIARVFDAGTTETGRPYFVMELVKGVPITEYCDKNKLTLGQRLNLFCQVCHAVQHAHQKGIIHRDIKPSNVMVTLYDGKPVPKVIDFGVSKAIQQKLTERTLFTAYGNLIGTPEYMSPEQAEMSGLDVDTRTDVYALGVLLYELLTGTTPITREELNKAGFDEMLRTIREVEPPRPSIRLSQSGEALASISEHRRVEPGKLSRFVRGDLDWIVMKALEKDRTRRYETSNAVASDVKRYLEHEAVEARPPSTAYRLGKFASKYRKVMAIAAAFMALLTLSTVVSVSLAVQFNRQRNIAEIASARERDAHNRASIERDRAMKILADLHEELIEKLLTAALTDEDVAWNEAVKKAREAELPNVWIDIGQGLRHFFRADYREARQQFSAVAQADPENVSAWSMLAISSTYDGDFDTFYEALARAEPLVPETTHGRLLKAYVTMFADSELARKELEEIVEEHPSWGLAGAVLGEARGYVALDTGDYELAKSAIDDVKIARWLHPDSPYVAIVETYLYHVAIRLGDELGVDTSVMRRDVASIASELDSTPHLLWVRGWLNEYLNDAEQAKRDFYKASRVSGLDDFIAYNLTAILFREANFDDALSVVRAKHRNAGPYARIAEAYVLASSEDTQAESQRIVQDILASNVSQAAKIDALPVLLLLGDVDAVTARASDLLDDDGGKSFVLDRHKYALEYLAGGTEEEYRQSASCTRRQECYTHYVISLRALAEGNREKVKKHLQQSVDTGAFLISSYPWAKALLTRLHQEPTWPDWLPDSDRK